MTQFVACSFRPGSRLYTYHNDGDPVTVGAQVKVADRDDPEAWKRVTVEAVVDKPDYPTKPILGIAPKEEPK